MISGRMQISTVQQKIKLRGDPRTQNAAASGSTSLRVRVSTGVVPHARQWRYGSPSFGARSRAGSQSVSTGIRRHNKRTQKGGSEAKIVGKDVLSILVQFFS